MDILLFGSPEGCGVFLPLLNLTDSAPFVRCEALRCMHVSHRHWHLCPFVNVGGDAIAHRGFSSSFVDHCSLIVRPNAVPLFLEITSLVRGNGTSEIPYFSPGPHGVRQFRAHLDAGLNMIQCVLLINGCFITAVIAIHGSWRISFCAYL